MSATAPTTRFVPRSDRRLSLGGVLRAERIKLHSVRSAWWCLGVLAVVTVGLGALMGSSLNFDGVAFTPTRAAEQAMSAYAVTLSTDFTALVVGVLGVLVVAGEYGTGTIRSTLVAVPTRLPVLAAKAIVVGVATAVVAIAALAVTVPISVVLLAGGDVRVDLADPRYWVSVLGAVAYLVLVGVIAVALAGIVRSTAGGVALTLGLLLGAPVVLGLVSAGTEAAWVQNVATVMPAALGTALFTYPVDWAGDPSAAIPLPDGVWELEAGPAGLLLVAWAAVLLVVAGVLLRRRDA